MNKINVAIFGATSHIAQSLIYYFQQQPEKYQLHLFSRNNKEYLDYWFFGFSYQLDVIINCIGIGTYKEGFKYSDYFFVTEQFDNLIIDYLWSNPKTKYINFSTGVVHNQIDMSDLKQEDYFPIVKRNSEAKHRSLSYLNILDLRIYSYFSRWANLEKDNYFVNQIIKCIRDDKIFTTDNRSFVRDFIHPEDLFKFICYLIELDELNYAFEVGSLMPISKQSILNFYKKEYNLKYEIVEAIDHKSSTGFKNEYYSKDVIKFDRVHTSLDTLYLESKLLWEKIHG